jgi:hypothetical protein
MSGFVLLAKPWWVNLLILAPAVPWLLARKQKLNLVRARLVWSAAFGIAFGFVEAAVVVYLRAATGLLPVPQTETTIFVPPFLLRVECFREAATMVMLIAVAWLAVNGTRERITAFLWTFAFWDFFYYVWLRVAIGWPASLVTPDLLFLLPVPWISQVWFPLLVSGLTIISIWLCSATGGNARNPLALRAETAIQK